jgi:hypothetical protein
MSKDNQVTGQSSGQGKQQSSEIAQDRISTQQGGRSAQQGFWPELSTGLARGRLAAARQRARDAPRKLGAFPVWGLWKWAVLDHAPDDGGNGPAVR